MFFETSIFSVYKLNVLLFVQIKSNQTISLTLYLAFHLYIKFDIFMQYLFVLMFTL